MLLRDLFDRALFEPSIRGANRWEVIEALVDRVASERGLSPSQRRAVLDVVIERERSLGTGLEKGVAIPHGFSPLLDETCMVLGTCPQGVPFDALDGEPARVVVLLVAPNTPVARSKHLQILALLSQFLMDQGVRDALMTAHSENAVRAVVETFAGGGDGPAPTS